MERVLFEVEGAGELVDHLRRTRSALEVTSVRVGDLLRSADRDPRSVARRVTETAAWAGAVADDLAWRLEFLASCQPGLPNAMTNADGMLEGFLPFCHEAEAERWAAGTTLHADLLQALDRIDGAEAQRLLDDLDGLLDDPMALAGFASVLGPDGLVGIVDAIGRARREDPVNTWSEIWAGAKNPRWDWVQEQLSDIAERAGGLLTYAPDAPVGLQTPEGILVVTMRDLLLADPGQLAGLWGDDSDLGERPFFELGGIAVRTHLAAPHMTDNGLVVPDTNWIADALTHPVTGAAVGAPGAALKQLFTELPQAGPWEPRYVLDSRFAPDRVWLPDTPTNVGRVLRRLGPWGKAFDATTIGIETWRAGAAAEPGLDRARAVAAALLDEGTNLALGAAGATAGTAVGAGLCVAGGVTAPAAGACGLAGGILGGLLGEKVPDVTRGLDAYLDHMTGSWFR